MQSLDMVRQFSNLIKQIPGRQPLIFHSGLPKFGFLHRFSTDAEDSKLNGLLEYLDNLKNYEKLGLPRGAGTDSSAGFDLGRMEHLMERLGNPQSKFKAVHIAGTKGKGSTAAFLSNILREEGHSVGCYTSPHLWSIRERISLGARGDPVSAEALMDGFQRIKKILDQSIVLENGSLSHFEVLTALAFTLFALEKVDIAIIEAGLGGARDATNILSSSGVAASVITTIGEEHLAALGGSLESIAMAKSGIIKPGRPVVIGGPFKPHIEDILRQRASLMKAPVVSTSHPGIQSIVKGIERENGKPYQLCDILIRVDESFIELFDVRLYMLGNHQLQNAVTATCAALCVRDQGWRVSNKSILAGLESTCLLGRSQYLTSDEAEAVGLSGVSILLDGAHTDASAKALSDTIRMTHPDRPVALVVAMASDKDHLAFARQLLLGTRPDVVLLTEVCIAGDKFRMASVSLLNNAWTRAALELGIDILDIGIGGHEKFLDGEPSCVGVSKSKSVLMTGCEMGSIEDRMKVTYQLLRARTADQSSLIVVTGSLHIVSSVLASLRSEVAADHKHSADRCIAQVKEKSK